MLTSLIFTIGTTLLADPLPPQNPIQPVGAFQSLQPTFPTTSNSPPGLINPFANNATSPANRTPGLLPQLQAAPLVPVVQESLISFDPTTLRLDWSDRRWKVVAGETVLDDLGTFQLEARELLQYLRDGGVTTRGRIGTTQTILDYWLSSGQAAPAGTGRRIARPFETNSLRVESMNGAWIVRDRKQILMSFGPHETDARLTMQVCQKYGFNEVVYIGSPTPIRMMLSRDRTRIDPPARANEPNGIQPVRADIANGMLQSQSFILPGIGYVGERIPIQSHRLDVVRDGIEYQLVCNGQVLANFGASERDARQALQTLRDFRATDIIRIGRSPIVFFLNNDRPPQTAPLGSRSTRFRRDELQLKEFQGKTMLMNGQRALLEFDDPLTAKLTLEVIQFYRFDQLCGLGHPLRGGMRWLSRAW
ncbi:hypothetical protein [Tuwongella immobilis]|uniref:Uncharacterized protein n=1 Tax=Tuwongella immobilis TaxID=692036 RepID=A0A6C2YNV9_9BACT|nr:hypothetical protein [Tuwongella immobilis]VIP02572.1 Uncharacterized protein OS=Prosthecochloris aestuarii (strain DSM 271 / SK 413) GN=Paes_0093 PE=4 SV=1 [Tuwongella immobilis]VTS01805.1 Uncharacterized protein OS=Prosthecochloris aestuarii (strain DSM 271 / SK 413) GN=Paes_0093 PE=4 SV=1 [Tuwongella immobilis]